MVRAIAGGQDVPAARSDAHLYGMTTGDQRFAQLAILSPAVRAGLNYWLGRHRADGLPPGRPDIDPVDMPSLLPNVVLIDVRRDPTDFRYRLVGGKVRHHLNANLLGLWMSDIPHQKAPSHLWSKCLEAVDSRSPVLSNTPYIGPHRDFLRAEDLILPLCDDEGRVHMLLVFVDFLHKNYARAVADATR